MSTWTPTPLRLLAIACRLDEARTGRRDGRSRARDTGEAGVAR